MTALLCPPHSPATGRRLRFGPAMSARAGTVELPMVAALFSDIAAPPEMRQRQWRRNPLPAAGTGSPRTPRTPRMPPGRLVHGPQPSCAVMT